MPAKQEITRKPVTLKLPPDLIERVAVRAKRLGMTKTAFHERALEAALGGAGPKAPRVAAGRPVADPPAPPRAPVLDPAVDRAAAFRAAQARRDRA